MKSHHGSISLWQDASVPDFPRLRASVKADVCVIGAGIAGMSAAYHLARQGLEVVVLDSGIVGGGETGRTSGHLTYAMDDRFYELERLHGREGARKVAESHRAAIDRIETIVYDNAIDCDFRRVDGYLMAAAGDPDTLLDQEFRAARALGLKEIEVVSRVPFLRRSVRGLRFPRQAHFHSLKYLGGLSRALMDLGVDIHHHSHVIEVRTPSPTSACVITKDGHVVECTNAVVATNAPINNRFLIHTKQAAYRTYVVGFSLPEGFREDALLWDTARPYHYVCRFGDMLLVGGEDHKTGQARDHFEHFSGIEKWAHAELPELGPVRYRWSGQVMEPVDGIAYIGRNPLESPNILLATGDSGQGLTHGTLAGMILSDLIMNRPNEWAEVYSPGRINRKSLGHFLEENVNTAAQYMDWMTPGEVTAAEEIPFGQGAILRRGAQKIAVYRDRHGQCHERSAACPHLYGLVHWNDAEKTWDCPCHGSRFDCMGSVIQGPAVSDLKPVESPLSGEGLKVDGVPLVFRKGRAQSA